MTNSVVVFTEDALSNYGLAKLVDIYNDLGPARPAGPQTFASRKKAIARILALYQEKIPTKVPLATFTAPAAVAASKFVDPNLTEVRRLLHLACTPGTAEAAVHEYAMAAAELIRRHGMSPAAFTWPTGYDNQGKLLTSTVAPASAPRPVPVTVAKPTTSEPTPTTISNTSASPARPPRRATIRALAESLLLQVVSTNADGRPVGLSYDEILDRIHADRPGANTSNACLRWYSSHMRTAGQVLPIRPASASK